MSLHFIGTCVGLEFEDLQEFDDSSRSIGYRTFLKHMGGAAVRELDQRFGLPLRTDWHVSFARGKWKGEPAICLFHSRIHHLWKL
jgi:hypothetical protein